MIRSKAVTGVVFLLLLAVPFVLGAVGKEVKPFTDNFSDPTTGWLEYEDASRRYAYEDDAYVIEVSGENQLERSWAPQRVATEDFVVKTAFRQVGTGSGTCGLFWGEDDQHYMMVQVSMSGWYAVDEFSDGQWENLISWKAVDPEFDPSASHELAVVKEGSSIAIYVDETLLTDSLTDRGFDQYNVGVFACTGGESGFSVAFDEFTIGETFRPTRRISLPYDWTNPPLEVHSSAHQWGFARWRAGLGHGGWALRYEETPWWKEGVTMYLLVASNCYYSVHTGSEACRLDKELYNDEELSIHIEQQPNFHIALLGTPTAAQLELPDLHGDITVRLLQGCLAVQDDAVEVFSTDKEPSYRSWYYDFNLDPFDPYCTFWVRIDYAGSSFYQEIDMSKLGHGKYH